MKLNCLIVDDEAIARRGIGRYVGQVPFLITIGSVRTASEATPFLAKTDLMILDIQLPQINGLDFLKSLAKPPVTILLTAYAGFALQGFDLDVIDYIVKPASFERFLKACTKAHDYITLRESSKANDRDYMFIKVDGKIERIFFNDILFVEAEENYSRIHTVHGKFLTLMSLGSIESSLDADNFKRVHKSYIVAMARIDRMGGNFVFIGANEIPVSRRVKKELKESLK